MGYAPVEKEPPETPAWVRYIVTRLLQRGAWALCGAGLVVLWLIVSYPAWWRIVVLNMFVRS